LNKLVTGAAKVLILGRPTAFLSKDERESVLRGSRRVGRAKVRTPGAPEYREVELLPFSPAQLRQFVSSYLDRHRRMADTPITEALIHRRQREIEAKINDDLISRPIHARMLGDLATNPDFDMEALTRYDLYNDFVIEVLFLPAGFRKLLISRAHGEPNRE
jgi:hypothetical protein